MIFIIKYILALFILFATIFALESASYQIGSVHLGLAGDVGESSDYTTRQTLTHEQPSDPNAESSSYISNMGWLGYTHSFVSSISSNVTKSVVCLTYNFVRVNRDTRRTRAMPTICLPPMR